MPMVVFPIVGSKNINPLKGIPTAFVGVAFVPLASCTHVTGVAAEY